jgi:hypothetical protein
MSGYLPEEVDKNNEKIGQNNGASVEIGTGNLPNTIQTLYFFS